MEFRKEIQSWITIKGTCINERFFLFFLFFGKRNIDENLQSCRDARAQKKGDKRQGHDGEGV